MTEKMMEMIKTILILIQIHLIVDQAQAQAQAQTLIQVLVHPVHLIQMLIEKMIEIFKLLTMMMIKKMMIIKMMMILIPILIPMTTAATPVPMRRRASPGLPSRGPSPLWRQCRRPQLAL